MTGAYAKEFEKWLESKNDDTVKSSDSDDQDSAQVNVYEDEVDNPFGYQSNPSTAGRDLTGDVAPVLSDDEDHDDEYKGIDSKVENPYEEEPPVLEPVPSMPNQNLSLKSPQLGEVPFKPVKSLCKDKTSHLPFSNIDSGIQKSTDRKDCNKLELKKRDAISNFGGNKVTDEYDCSKKRGNIFDKFNTVSEQCDDVPPPLIPSPVALLNDKSPKCSEDEDYNIKPPNDSPDFCAMEADSTSEIFKSEAFGRKEKVSSMIPLVGEGSIECDSTCMLGASPNVVSPSYASNIDTDDAASHSDVQSVYRELADENNQEFNAETRQQDSPIQYSGTEMKEGRNAIKSCSWDQECPTLEAVNSVEAMDEKESQDTLIEEPPVLSVSVSDTFQSLRRKRHTIDAMENIVASAKRKNVAEFVCSERQTNIDLVKDQHFSNPADKNVVDSFNQRRKHSKSSKKKHSHLSKEKHYLQHKVRSRSYSLIDSNKFIKRTSELSLLQSKMHKLVSLLFPEIAHELKNMSPESNHFENVLNGLTSSLHDSPLNVPENFTLTTSAISDKESVGPSKDLLSSFFVSAKCDDSFIQHPSESNHDSSSDISLHEKDNSSISSRHSTMPNETTDSCKVHCSFDSSHSDSMMPQIMSQLSLSSEKEKILKHQPSVVLKTNVSVALHSFSKLSCNVLQLLLPDLAINLYDALGDSYHDLLNLIDSVTLSNSVKEKAGNCT